MREAYRIAPVPPLLKPVIVTRSVSTLSTATISAKRASKAAAGSSSHHIPFACGKTARFSRASSDERAVCAVGIARPGPPPRTTTSGNASSPR